AARLEIEIVSTASGPPALALVGEAKAGEPIRFAFSNLPGGSSDWIALTAAGKPDSVWDDWAYTYGKTDGEMSFRAQPAGDYELRAYSERPQRSVVVRLPVTIAP